MKKSLILPVFLVICLAIFTTLLVNLPGQATDNHIRLKVLGQKNFLAGGPASLRIITLDEASMMPLKNVKTTISILAGEEETELISDWTDVTGSIEANFKIPSDIEGSAKLKIIAATETDREDLTVDISVKKAYQLLLTTDKPLYQPGQVIHVRLLALTRPTMEPVKGQTVTFEIEDGKGNKVFKDSVEVSEFGVASAEFELANEVNMGQYHIKALLKKEKNRKKCFS